MTSDAVTDVAEFSEGKCRQSRITNSTVQYSTNSTHLQYMSHLLTLATGRIISKSLSNTCLIYAIVFPIAYWNTQLRNCSLSPMQSVEFLKRLLLNSTRTLPHNTYLDVSAETVPIVSRTQENTIAFKFILGNSVSVRLPSSNPESGQPSQVLRSFCLYELSRTGLSLGHKSEAPDVKQLLRSFALFALLSSSEVSYGCGWRKA